MTPHDDAVALAGAQLDRERTVSAPEREMTFYNALTSTTRSDAAVPEPSHPTQAASSQVQAVPSQAP